MNCVQILGNMTHDPEIRLSASGKKYVFFSVATNYKDKATFIPVTAFNGLAEWICKYFKKGSRIAITGHLDTSNKDQNFRMNVIADEGYFAEKASNEKNNNNDFSAKEIEANEEELPF